MTLEAGQVPRAARPLTDDWVRLGRGSSASDLFDPAHVETLPEPAGRWLRHASRLARTFRRRCG